MPAELRDGIVSKRVRLSERKRLKSPYTYFPRELADTAGFAPQHVQQCLQGVVRGQCILFKSQKKKKQRLQKYLLPGWF